MLVGRLRLSILGLAMVLVGGAIGYRVIEGWSWLDAVWMVVITLTTIGYGEREPLSDLGRVYTIGLVAIGLLLATFMVTTVTQFVVEGGLVEQLRRRSREKRMKKIRDHFVVVGFGRLGRELCAELAHRGHSIVVIEPHVTEPHADYVHVEGDGESDEVLMAAAIDRARGLAACTGSDATNLFITLSARQLNPDLNIVTRVDEEPSIQKALRIGANAVLNPYHIGGVRMAQGLLHPTAATLVDRTMGRAFEEFEMEDVVIGDSDYTGPVRELKIAQHHNVLVVAVRKPDGSFQRGHSPDTEIQAGDIAVVVGSAPDIRGFANAVRGRPVR